MRVKSKILQAIGYSRVHGHIYRVTVTEGKQKHYTYRIACKSSLYVQQDYDLEIGQEVQQGIYSATVL